MCSSIYLKISIDFSSVSRECLVTLGFSKMESFAPMIIPFFVKLGIFFPYDNLWVLTKYHIMFFYKMWNHSFYLVKHIGEGITKIGQCNWQIILIYIAQLLKPKFWYLKLPYQLHKTKWNILNLFKYSYIVFQNWTITFMVLGVL